METSPGRGLGVKSVSNRQGSPQPRTQVLSTASLTPNMKTRGGEGLLAPLLFGQWRGQVWSASHTAGCRLGEGLP